MIPRASRRFTLIDAMILIAAVAVGFAGVRAESGDHYHPTTAYILQESGKEYYPFLNARQTMPEWSIWLRTAAAVVVKAAPVVAALTLALVVIRFRRPQPSIRRLIRQPGMVADLAALATLAVNLLLGSFQILMAATGQSGMSAPRFYANFALLFCQTFQLGMVGIAVLVAWMVLALSGRWRWERGWLDRAEFGIGLAWVGLMGTDWVVKRFM